MSSSSSSSASAASPDNKSAASSANPPSSNSSPNSDANTKPIAPPPLHIIFFFVINIWFCFCISPFLAANANPTRNLQRIKILVADFDGGLVGTSLKDTKNWVDDHLMPDFFTFEYRNDLNSPKDVIDAVRDTRAYAAIYANIDSTASLNAVLASNCATAGTYDAMNAYTIVWDEGRSYTTENKIFGALVGLIPKINSLISTSLLTQQPPGTITTCIAAGNAGASILSNPISFTPVNLSPVTKAPVGNGLLTIGNILVAVFSSLFFVNAIYKGAAGNLNHMNPTKQALCRFSLFMIYDFGLAACLSTIVVGLAKDGSGDYLYSGSAWAQIFALQWVHAMIWTFGTACVYIGLSEILVPYNFCFILCSAILGGWNTDFADPSFYTFYKIFPFIWVNNVEKNILYESLPNVVGMSVGIILAEATFFTLLFFWINYKYYHMEVLNPQEWFSDLIKPKRAADYSFSSTASSSSSAAAIELTVSDVKSDYAIVRTDANP